MNQIERQFWSPIRSFLIRYNEYNRQKGVSSSQLDEFDQIYSKILSSRQLKEVVINKITSIQIKSDYHNLIMLTLLQDLCKWSREYYTQLKQHTGPLECIFTQSISIINSQQQYHTIVPKQNQLIALLLSHPNTLANMEHFKLMYVRLKDIKSFYPSSIRQHQKQCFLKAIQQCITTSSEMKDIQIIQFIFNDIFNQLQILDQSHDYVSQRLKIIKKILKVLWIYHEQILYRIGYLLMKYSYQILNNKHLFNYIMPIYQQLLTKLIQKPSITPLLIFKHLITTNITKILSSGGNFILLEILLSQLANIFQHEPLYYFMQYYDWNYLQIPICHQALNILYQYTENRANQRKVQFELAKTYLNRINAQIKSELQKLKGVKCDENKWKFYSVKRKQYIELLEEMNDKPKKIFKKIQNISNEDVREGTVNKYVRIVKKSAHLKNRSMIDIFSTDHVISAQLFSHYVQIVLKQCKQYNLQQFMRLFTSNFFLTGESQQIGRVMDTITQLYFSHQQQQKRILKSSDATYTFANAILILNTDLHNPKNQEKMSQQNFIKMCKKINDGEDLPLQIIRKTYNNIKKNKINTFRDRGDMIGISVSNWINICCDYESLPLAYYDNEMENLDQNFLQYFIYDALSSIIDQKETAKLQILVQRFTYDDKIFQCQIIETLRQISDKKPHLPLHILQKILELGNFKNNKTNIRLLSYYWLASNVISTFWKLIPTNVICQFMVFTWNIRIELQDNLYSKQLSQIRRIRECMKYVTKRESKKSIMDMFSNFLSFKQSDDEPQVLPNQFSKKNSFKSLSQNIFDIFKQSQHKIAAIQFFVEYIHNEESKQYQEFISCLFLIFNLLYVVEGSEKVGQDLFYELLGVKQSSITKRLSNLGKKDGKLYNTLINYCKYWIVKLMFKQYTPSKLQNRDNNNYQYLLRKSLEYFQKIDKQILNDLLKQLNSKTNLHPIIYEALENAVKKIYTNVSHNQTQFFFEHFSKISFQQKQKSKNEIHKYQGETVHRQQNKIVKEQQLPLVSQIPHQVGNKEIVVIEQQSIKKQSSINQLQIYVNQEQTNFSSQLDKAINQHKQQVSKNNQNEIGKIQSNISEENTNGIHEQKGQIADKQEDTPSIPIVMF